MHIASRSEVAVRVAEREDAIRVREPQQEKRDKGDVQAGSLGGEIHDLTVLVLALLDKVGDPVRARDGVLLVVVEVFAAATATCAATLGRRRRRLLLLLGEGIPELHDRSCCRPCDGGPGGSARLERDRAGARAEQADQAEQHCDRRERCRRRWASAGPGRRRIAAAQDDNPDAEKMAKAEAAIKKAEKAKKERRKNLWRRLRLKLRVFNLFANKISSDDPALDRILKLKRKIGTITFM